MSSFKSISLIVMLAMALSCSVKEDRHSCLCCLGLDYSECDDNANKLILIGWDGDMSESFRSTPSKDCSSAYCEYYVPRGTFTLSASVGAAIADGKYVMSTDGRQADSLYACSDRFQTDSEYCFRKIRLNKQFTTVRLITAGNDYLDDGIIVKGGSIGMSLLDMSPLNGDFTCVAERISEGIFSFRLLRQSGEVTITMTPSRSGVKIRKINLSNLLDACGYDWSESSLRDIDLYLDNARANVSIQVSGWDFVETIYLEI